MALDYVERREAWLRELFDVSERRTLREAMQLVDDRLDELGDNLEEVDAILDRVASDMEHFRFCYCVAWQVVRLSAENRHALRHYPRAYTELEKLLKTTRLPADQVEMMLDGLDPYDLEHKE